MVGMEDTFLTVAEVAELLKLDQQTVRNWIDRGDLAAVRVGQRRVRIRQSHLDAFVAGRAVRAEQVDTARRVSRQDLIERLERVESRLEELTAAVDRLAQQHGQS